MSSFISDLTRTRSCSARPTSEPIATSGAEANHTAARPGARLAIPSAVKRSSAPRTLPAAGP